MKRVNSPDVRGKSRVLVVPNVPLPFKFQIAIFNRETGLFMDSCERLVSSHELSSAVASKTHRSHHKFSEPFLNCMSRTSGISRVSS
jgi:hypothetical protein